MKLGFLGLLLVACAVIWLHQVQDPSLPAGWGSDLQAALRTAKANRARVLIFFTSSPMNDRDKHAVQNTVGTGRADAAMSRLRLVKVHLNTKADRQQAERFRIESTPTFLLLDQDGNELRRETSSMNDLTFTGEFLRGTAPVAPPASGS